MLVSKKTLDLVYKLSAIARFNPERSGVVNDLLIKVIEEKIENLDISTGLNEIKKSQDSRFDKEKPLTWIFELQQEIVFSKLESTQVMEVIEKMYLPLALLCDDLGAKTAMLISVSRSIATICGKHARSLHFDNRTYQFENKAEYTNLSFVKIPDQNYIDIWAKSITFKKNDIINDFESIREEMGVEFDAETARQMTDAIEETLARLSLPEQKTSNIEPFAIVLTPLLKLDQETYVLVGNYYIIRALLYRCELILKGCQTYRDLKGKFFEKISLELFLEKYRDNFHPNIKYKNGGNTYEVDGLLNLSTSSWFIECSSHPPKMSTGFNDSVDLFEDFRKSVIKCQNQGARAIDNSNNEAIMHFQPNEKKGIIIIIDEHYPNISEAHYKYFEKVWKSEGKELLEQLKNPIPKINYPRYVINYFELQTMLAQPDANLFEEFLFWRTQENMPIACSDELDYWDYFTKMREDKDRQEAFRLCQERGHIVNYIGNRFNDKHYLDKIMEKESKDQKP